MNKLAQWLIDGKEARATLESEIHDDILKVIPTTAEMIALQAQCDELGHDFKLKRRMYSCTRCFELRGPTIDVPSDHSTSQD